MAELPSAMDMLCLHAVHVLTIKLVCKYVVLQDAKDRLAYLTRRKQHKAKREQQKRVTVLEDRRQVRHSCNSFLVAHHVCISATLLHECTA